MLVNRYAVYSLSKFLSSQRYNLNVPDLIQTFLLHQIRLRLRYHPLPSQIF